MMNNDDSNPLAFHEFPGTSEADWLQKVKSDLKDTPLDTLNWRIADGIRMPAMAFMNKERHQALRSLEQSTYSDDPAYGPRKWFNYEYVVVDDAKAANQQALQALEMGADGVYFQLEEEVDLQVLLQGILPAYCGLAFKTPFSPDALFQSLSDFYTAQQVNMQEAEGFIAFDPIKTAILKPGIAFKKQLVNYVSEVIKRGGYKAFSVDAGLYSDAGANTVQQITLALHHTVAYLDMLTDAGIPAQQALDSMVFQMGTGTSYFPEIAKFRAYRALLKRIANAYGSTDWEPYLFGYSSQWSKSFYDPYVNMLRNTTETMSSILGGVNGLSTFPHNTGIAQPGSSDRRMSRNVSLLLREESYFDKVADPVAGSYYLEELTTQLMEQSWTLFLALEAQGSWEDNLASGYLLGLVKQARMEQQIAIGKRKQILVGTNMHPNPKDTAARLEAPEFIEPTHPWHPRHATAEIEAFRRKMEGRKVPIRGYMLPLSQGFMTAARLNFSLSYLGVAGIALQEWEGPIADMPPADLVVLCGSDEDYVKDGIRIIHSLKESTSAKIFLAGDPGEHKAPLVEAGLDGWFSARSNVTEDLQQLLALIS